MNARAALTALSERDRQFIAVTDLQKQHYIVEYLIDESLLRCSEPKTSRASSTPKNRSMGKSEGMQQNGSTENNIPPVFCYAKGITTASTDSKRTKLLFFRKDMAKAIFTGTIFSSAFLLFLIQPIISKNILPWFGGTAGVWAVCMVFFQVVLLIGYTYSDWTSRYLKSRTQVVIHCVLLVLSLISLPVIADISWKPTGNADPTIWILMLLVSTVGLPYFLLSTTGPLVQSWVSRTLVGTQVYRFFSLSNLASLIALICYPFFIEPYARLATQAYSWSGVYLIFVVFCAASGWYVYRHAPAVAPNESIRAAPGKHGKKPLRRDYLLWLGLSAMGSWLLVAITNHITQNVAAIPFLWLLPLTLYLLTFVLCFESDRWYRRGRFLLPSALLLVFCAYGLLHGNSVKHTILFFAVSLFVLCMFLHGELAAMKPAPDYLTRFYLMLSLGGALGGIAVALGAPRLLPAYYELGIGLVVIAMLAMFVLKHHKYWVICSAILAVICSYLLYVKVVHDLTGARRIDRNFYGSLRTVDVKGKDPVNHVRQLYHGSIKHGEQYLAASRKMEPTTYYGRTSGVGLALNSGSGDAKKVGLIGLGAGTLATYGRAGDTYRFYEINPKVLEIAQNEFTFVRDSKAKIETVLGDARLLLESEAANNFDVLAIDAFSGGSIPVHLLTREAMAIYRHHIDNDGIIAIHISNKYLSLSPVVVQLAEDQGMFSALIRDEAKNSPLYPTEWVLVAKNQAVLQQPAIKAATSAVPKTPTSGVWTDDFNNLLQVMR